MEDKAKRKVKPKVELVQLRLDIDTYKTYERIAKRAEVSVDVVIKVALATFIETTPR